MVGVDRDMTEEDERLIPTNIERPTMFIGSSAEGLVVARAVKAHLESDIEVDIWDEGVFQLNQSSLDSLLHAASLYDFAVLVLTPDDLLKSRGKRYKAARDNVVFEHGLFLGRLGPRRAFIMCEESVKVLSDFAGITISRFTKPVKGNLRDAVANACDQIRKSIKESLHYAELGFYPSTVLAIGYFENFISKIFTSLLQKSYVVKVNGKEQTNLQFQSFTFTIVIPDSLGFVEKANLELTVKIKELQQIVVHSITRDFPFYVRADFRGEKELHLYDVPTTLLSSRKAIELLLSKPFIGQSWDQEKLERREIRNFRLALESLLKKNFPDHLGTTIRLEGPECMNSKA
ncbi:MAG: hypothetical protein HW389_466 [Bacteroidetes bacterium]|nr:hypothetical protein [Bacteroidota bacterium]